MSESDHVADNIQQSIMWRVKFVFINRRWAVITVVANIDKTHIERSVSSQHHDVSSDSLHQCIDFRPPPFSIPA